MSFKYISDTSDDSENDDENINDEQFSSLSEEYQSKNEKEQFNFPKRKQFSFFNNRNYPLSLRQKSLFNRQLTQNNNYSLDNLSASSSSSIEYDQQINRRPPRQQITLPNNYGFDIHSLSESHTSLKSFSSTTFNIPQKNAFKDSKKSFDKSTSSKHTVDEYYKNTNNNLYSASLLISQSSSLDRNENLFNASKNVFNQRFSQSNLDREKGGKTSLGNEYGIVQELIPVISGCCGLDPPENKSQHNPPPQSNQKKSQNPKNKTKIIKEPEVPLWTSSSASNTDGSVASAASKTKSKSKPKKSVSNLVFDVPPPTDFRATNKDVATTSRQKMIPISGEYKITISSADLDKNRKIKPEQEKNFVPTNFLQPK